MKFHILTLFPEMILRGLEPSIIGRAAEKNLIAINAVNIRDYTTNKHGKVDDYPYGGGAGMLMQAQPVYDAWKAVTGGKKLRTVYVTPQGKPFTQKLAEELSKEEELVLLCGHYEGIDQRVLEETVSDYVSIGDYVLTGGELPAMVMIDAIARLLPGVLGNDASSEEESFYNDLLEYPQYSRPEVWHEKEVPPVLLSGNHKKVLAWRLEKAKEKTAQVRPDLYEKYEKKQQLRKQLLKDKRNTIHLTESLLRGRAEILYWDGADVMLYDRQCSICMITAASAEAAEKMLAYIPEDTRCFITSQAFVNELLCRDGACQVHCECYQLLYTEKTPLPVRHKDIRRLTPEYLDYVSAHYENDGREYVQECLQKGYLYGAFVEDKLAGFIGMHTEGSMGLLYVEEAYRRQGLAVSLESYNINAMLEKGWTPYGHVIVGNEASFALQEKLGLYRSDKTIWWVDKKTLAF